MLSFHDIINTLFQRDTVHNEDSFILLVQSLLTASIIEESYDDEMMVTLSADRKMLLIGPAIVVMFHPKALVKVYFGR